MRTLLLAFAVAWLSTSVMAHDVGCDGKPVPANIKLSCCGKADYHRLTADQYREEPDGSYTVIYPPWRFRVPRERVLPPPDGCAAIFFSINIMGIDGIPQVWCFMVPMGV